MAGGTQGGDDEGLITDINVTPLVDVVLVLLIILMVTATAIVSKTIPMELPKAATGEKTPSTMTISIDAAGDLFLDAQPITTDALRAKVHEAQEQNQDLRAVIAADGRTEHAKVVHVIDDTRIRMDDRLPLILLGDFNVWQGPGKLRPLIRVGLQCTAVRTFSWSLRSPMT